MSTRCQIAFEGSDVKVYKHSDGYPEGVLPLLKKVLPDFAKERGWDPSYLAAHTVAKFIDASRRKLRAFYLRKHKENPNVFKKDGWKSSRFLGYGLDTDYHGDLDYIYTVRADFSVEVRALKQGGVNVTLHTAPDFVVTLDALKTWKQGTR